MLRRGGTVGRKGVWDTGRTEPTRSSPTPGPGPTGVSGSPSLSLPESRTPPTAVVVAAAVVA